MKYSNMAVTLIMIEQSKMIKFMMMKFYRKKESKKVSKKEKDKAKTSHRGVYSPEPPKGTSYA